MDNRKMIKKVKIGIIGAGGGGTNAVANNAHKFAPFNIDFLAINTDEQALIKQAQKRETARFFQRKLIGKNLTDGLGAGAIPSIGWKAAAEDKAFLEKWLSDKKIVFIATGLGGGTGTGAAPYCARLATMMGILTVSISTLPFEFEGKERMENALTGLKTLEKYSDLSIIINNNDLFKKHSSDTVESTFNAADRLLGDGIITILNLILEDAYINLDFADIRKVVSGAGGGFINIGFAKGISSTGLSDNQEKLADAVERLLDSTLIPSEMRTAKRALLSISGARDNLIMDYVRFIINSILEIVNPELDVIFGLTINESLEDNLKISLILTGMDKLSITDDIQDIEEKYIFGETKESKVFDS